MTGYKNEVEYDFEHGWTNLVDVTIDQVKKTDKKIKILQAFESDGRLKIKYTPHNPSADKIIEIARDLASETCESCGESGRLQSVHGKYKTLCGSCVSKRL